MKPARYFASWLLSRHCLALDAADIAAERDAALIRAEAAELAGKAATDLYRDAQRRALEAERVADQAVAKAQEWHDLLATYWPDDISEVAY